MSETHTLGPMRAASNFSDPKTLEPNTIIQRAKNIHFEQFDDELLAVDAEASVCFSLNESAGRIWQLIETPITLGALCAQLCLEYDVDEESCLREVSTLLQGLSHAGLVKTDNDANA